MADKVTTMVVKVDLGCPSCHKKIKKILAQFPEIRDQVYDFQKGTVTISVVHSNPEKIRDKLCCKGGKVIKGIEIKVPAKAPDPGKKETGKPEQKGNDQKTKPSGDDQKAKQSGDDQKAKPSGDDQKTKPSGKDDKTNGKEGKSTTQKEPPPPPPPPVLVPGYPPYYPVGVCCGPCYEGRGGGPCYHGHGLPVPPYDNYGYPTVWYSARSDYFSEENPYACTIM